MDKKEKRMLYDEVYMLGEQKEFKPTNVGIKQTLKQLVISRFFSKKGKAELENMRKSYNYTFVQICDKHGVENTENIYSKLDSIWDGFDTFEKGANKVMRHILLPVAITEIIATWNNYVRATRELAKELN
jgi:hypothetical protein